MGGGEQVIAFNHMLDAQWLNVIPRKERAVKQASMTGGWSFVALNHPPLICSFNERGNMDRKIIANLSPNLSIMP